MEFKDIKFVRQVSNYYVNIEHNNLIHSFGITESKGAYFGYFDTLEVYKIKDGNYAEYKKLSKKERKMLRKFAEVCFKEENK